ncbi:hypothetical protein [uncultured Helicobacter sp.]|uniref:hypothetical protein n=1 Tax=uncultured Helicobacter sp. TaxID=175537 RepID=UPI002602CA71|nr:hypothetical protein [uncultured Helicobacter sp.]
MIDPVWGKLTQINALRNLWLDVVKLPIIGIDLKNEILHITFAHPAHLQEWKINEERFLQELREEYKKRELKKIVVFRKIVCKERFKRVEKPINQEEGNCKEKAKGDFTNHCTNSKLFEAFERIRKTIRSKNDTQAENLS